MCIGHNACCGVERIVKLWIFCVQCFVELLCLFMCAIHIVITLWELLFSLLLGDWPTLQCCLWCMSVMVVAQHHHMWSFHVIYQQQESDNTDSCSIIDFFKSWYTVRLAEWAWNKLKSSRFSTNQQGKPSLEIKHVMLGCRGNTWSCPANQGQPSGSQFTILPTGSDNPNHRKCLTQPQDVISTESWSFSLNEAFLFILSDVKCHKMASLALLTLLVPSLSHWLPASLLQSLSGTKLQSTSEFWQ